MYPSLYTVCITVKDDADLVSMCKLDALVPYEEPVSSSPYILRG